MTESQTKLYGVSSGDGNNGVSHMFADYYVRTSDPYRLAELALLAEFKPGKGQAWARDNADIDGESDYTISAMILNPPCEDSADGEYPEIYRCVECGHITDSDQESCPDCDAIGTLYEDSEHAEDGRNWSDGNGAWLIVEIFPADDSDTRDRPVYDSLEDAFSSDLVASVAP